MKALSKEDIVKAANWLKRKIELEKELAEHNKFCCHWAVEQKPITLDRNGNVNQDRKNICDFCGKEMNYFTYTDTPIYMYKMKSNGN